VSRCLIDGASAPPTDLDPIREVEAHLADGWTHDVEVHIAATYLASLRQPDEMSVDELEQVWADEIQRRVERVRSGESPTVAWSEVRAEAERRLAAR
jgi:hypothetical protein